MVYRRILLRVVIAALAGAIAGCSASKKITTEKPAPQPAAPPSSQSALHPAPLPVPPLPSAHPSAAGLPLVPETAPDAPLHIRVAYPVPGQLIQRVDSNFIFGSVGNGHASLTIDGFLVPLSKNGAFLAFLPMPENGKYRLVAARGMDRDSATVAYSARTLEETPKKNIIDKEFEPQYAKIIKGSDTLQTGNDVAPGALVPNGNREWFFPRGAMLHLTEHEGKYYKVELDKTTFAWVADSNFELKVGQSGQGGTSVSLVPSVDYVDFVLPCHYNPFQIATEGTSIRIHLYGATKPESFDTTTNDPLIDRFKYDSTSGGVDFTVFLTKPVWGYKAFYTGDGALDVRIRRPPEIDPKNPLKGIRIMLDPGHPPGGAIGPMGLMEREANLAVAEKVRDQLTQKGAQVLMTHETLSGMVSDVNQTEELQARSAFGVQSNVDLMVSIHNNAFPDGTNPFLKYGTSTYYYQSFSAPLAEDLDKEIAPVTSIPNLGAKFKSLAVCRPTWMPCALTESLYLMFPDQENALRDPAFLDRLAAAHVRGIEDFLRERAQ